MRLLVLALLAVAANADAHTRSESYSHWHQSGNRVVATITVPLREVMLLYQVGNAELPPPDMLRAELLATTSVASDDGPCERLQDNALRAASGFVRVELEFDCGAAPPGVIHHRALFAAAPSHVHYAKLHRDGRFVAEMLITDAADRWDIGAIAADGTAGTHSFPSFLRLGIEHIAGGIDHIAFLAGLLLIAGSLRRSIVAVTGFTLGHSLSLAAATLGYVHAEGSLVEAFIGFTVALVAIEYFALRRSSATPLALVSLAAAWSVGLLGFAAGALAGRALLAYLGFGLFALSYLLASRHIAAARPLRSGTLLFVATTCFGLVHGFGFAGFLMDTGMLGGELFVPLLGFNLGVELGQLAIVGVAIVVAQLLRGRTPPAIPAAIAASLCGIGVFWFVERSLA